MTKLLSANLDLIAARVQTATRILLFTDFDGTLVPIQNSPSACFLDEELRQILITLSQLPKLSLAVVSGRELNDLKSRIAIENICYAGNHGLEIEAPGISFCEPTALALVPMMQALVSNLAQGLSGIQGVLIENKLLSISIHYRNVNPVDVTNLKDVTRSSVATFLQSKQVTLKNGKMVIEIRPAVEWHKGHAINWLVNKLLRDTRPLVIFIGDDETDEDAFAFLTNQITVRVGANPMTKANYVTPDQYNVFAFMAWLLEIVYE